MKKIFSSTYGVAESIDWCDALVQLNTVELDAERVDDTLGVLLKYQDEHSKDPSSTAAALLDELDAERTGVAENS